MAEQNLMNMSPAELVEALMNDNSLVSEFDRLCLWDKFVPFDWSKILSVPKFIEKAKEYSHGWVGLLSIKPELANECECWEEFHPWEWYELLKAQPQFADKCTEYKGWEKFYPDDWSFLLESQPQLWIYCPGASVNEIKKDPTNAKECKCWDWFSAEDGMILLTQYPQFADKCPDKMYDGFSQEQWAELEAKHPGVFEDRHMLSTLRKLAED